MADTWGWLHYIITGSFAYTTIAISWVKNDIRALWEAVKETNKLVSNEQAHEIAALKERIQKLEDHQDKPHA